MRALLQRVSEASVAVAGESIASIDAGLLVLLGVFSNDTEAQADWLAEKTLMLRIFADDDKPMNRSVMEVGGSVLVVSQFTLAADVSKGRRPGFSTAASPEVAQPLYERFLWQLQQRWAKVESGRFGADMQVALINDGPVTLMLEH